MVFWAPSASGPIAMRKVNDWPTLAELLLSIIAEPGHHCG